MHVQQKRQQSGLRAGDIDTGEWRALTAECRPKLAFEIGDVVSNTAVIPEREPESALLNVPYQNPLDVERIGAGGELLQDLTGQGSIDAQLPLQASERVVDREHPLPHAGSGTCRRVQQTPQEPLILNGMSDVRIAHITVVETIGERAVTHAIGSPPDNIRRQQRQDHVASAPEGHHVPEILGPERHKSPSIRLSASGAAQDRGYEVPGVVRMAEQTTGEHVLHFQRIWQQEFG